MIALTDRLISNIYDVQSLFKILILKNDIFGSKNNTKSLYIYIKI